MRSVPTSGVGGRLLTPTEREELLGLAERYGLDTDDATTSGPLLERIERAYGSYCAADAALSNQVGVTDEWRDMETLVARCRTVLTLVSHQVDLRDDQGCLRAAAALSQSLHAFPWLIDAQSTCWPERTQFVESRQRLRNAIVQVRLWAAHRAQLTDDLGRVIAVCERFERPRLFTKRTKTARQGFQRELASIYRELLHPLRHADWAQTRRDPNDPPPPESTSAFARGVMSILGVPFEVKGISG